MTPEYLAGFFDGEGWIGIAIGSRDGECMLRMTVTNTNLEFLKRVHAIYGGRLSVQLRQQSKWKDYCCIHWSHRAAARLLEQIGPYLILKRPQLTLALELIAMKALPRAERRTSGSWGSFRRPEIIARERELKARMHELNRRGKAA